MKSNLSKEIMFPKKGNDNKKIFSLHVTVLHFCTKDDCSMHNKEDGVGTSWVF